MESKRRIPLFIITFIISIILIICGCLILFIWPLLFNYLIDSQMILSPNSNTYELWKTFPYPVPIYFYFFNWTNPHQVFNKSIKMKFQQIGPYQFKEYKDKANIHWHPENGTVTYQRLNTWFIDDELKHTLSDRVTTVNPIALTSSYVARNWNFILKKGISASLSTSAPTINTTHTVSEFLFDGYDDILISIARHMPFLHNVGLPPWDRFGWFYTRNGSTEFDGVFNMGTGDNGTDFGRLYKWNYENRTRYYDDHCGEIGGSAGELFQRNPSKDSITIFSPDLCRTLTLDFEKETLVSDILGYKYSLGPRGLDNGTLVESNKCFCGGECIPSGLFNVSACRYGSPSFASLPHFLNADPYYRDLIDGMSPNPDQHEFFITLEPTTGIPVEVSARLQLNLMMRPTPGIRQWDSVPSVFVPMLWFEQKVKIPDNVVFQLRILLNLPVICSSLAILSICLGFFLLFCTFYKICNTKLCEHSKDDYIYKEQQMPLNDELNKTEIVSI